MVIQAKVIRECAVGPPGECPVQVELVGVTDEELEELENQVEAQGISFLNIRGQEVEELPQELEASGLCCPLEPDRAWDDSACAIATGWTEEEALQELAKYELLTDLKKLRDQGVF